ncbi:mutator type transposase [Tanacetum coccineum]
MSKDFRAKAKAERKIRGDHILQYSMLRDYVVELQSTNPNTTIKIAVERNTDPSLPTRVFQRIYVCLGVLKLGFRACRRDLFGLDGAFMKGPFLGQVLVAVGLDLNNRIYPLAYALVEAECKSSWCWFLQYLGDDIDLHPNLNFTFISNRQKGWCGQAYKDLLWRAASATNVRDFEKCMLKLNTMNPKAHEWLNKIPAEHWARSYFSGRAKYDLLLNNICEVFNGKIIRGRDKPVITLLEPKKKRKRSKNEDEPFVKYGKLSKKERTITCQSYGNIGLNKETCKGRGGNNAEAGGGASGAGVADGNGREIGDGIPRQSSAAGGATSDNGKFLVDEDISFKKISPLAEEIIVMIRKCLQKTKETSYKAKLMHLEDDMGW